MTPDDLLAEADRLLTTAVPGTAGRWPRACAWLIRLALESALDRYWLAVQPEAASCGMRPQLLLLPAYTGPDIAQRAREAWTGLARAAHHHPYELAPTAAELRGWHRAVSRLVTDLAAVPRLPSEEELDSAGAPGAPGAPDAPGAPAPLGGRSAVGSGA